MTQPNRAYKWGAGPNHGSTRIGLIVETRQHCANQTLWDSPYVKPGPEKGGLWFTRAYVVTLALPWWRGWVQWVRPTPAKVEAHMLQVQALAQQRRTGRTK